MMREIDIHLADGRVLHAYDTATADDTRLPVFWHHGSPKRGVAARAAFRRRGVPRPPLGFLRPAGVRRQHCDARPGHRVGRHRRGQRGIAWGFAACDFLVKRAGF